MTTATATLSPAEIVQRYYHAINAKDPAWVAPFLAEDVVRIGVMATDTPPHLTQGKTAVLARIQRVIDDNGALTVETLQPTGNRVHCFVQIATDTTRREQIAPLEESVEFFVEDGQIQSYQVVSTPASMVKIQATRG